MDDLRPAGRDADLPDRADLGFDQDRGCASGHARQDAFGCRACDACRVLAGQAEPAAGKADTKKLCVACHTFNESGKAGSGNYNERADVIAYLRTLSHMPAPLPKVTAN